MWEPREWPADATVGEAVVTLTGWFAVRWEVRDEIALNIYGPFETEAECVQWCQQKNAEESK